MLKYFSLDFANCSLASGVTESVWRVLRPCLAITHGHSHHSFYMLTGLYLIFKKGSRDARSGLRLQDARSRKRGGARRRQVRQLRQEKVRQD